MAEKLTQIKSANAEHSRAEQPFDVVASENQEEEVDVKAKEEMKPWEQHSAVISIPRFDYSAPSSILSRSHSGFLVTCPISKNPLPLCLICLQECMFLCHLCIS